MSRGDDWRRPESTGTNCLREWLVCLVARMVVCESIWLPATCWASRASRVFMQQPRQLGKQEHR
jgi:hypothetical protein